MIFLDCVCIDIRSTCIYINIPSLLFFPSPPCFPTVLFLLHSFLFFSCVFFFHIFISPSSFLLPLPFSFLSPPSLFPPPFSLSLPSSLLLSPPPSLHSYFESPYPACLSRIWARALARRRGPRDLSAADDPESRTFRCSRCRTLCFVHMHIYMLGLRWVNCPWHTADARLGCKHWCFAYGCCKHWGYLARLYCEMPVLAECNFHRNYYIYIFSLFILRSFCLRWNI